MMRHALPLLALPLVCFVGSSARAEVLDAVARESARPRACASGGGLWVSPSVTRSSGCTLLARGYSRLARDPAAALAIAGEVVKDARLREPALLLSARASVLLRDFEAAWAAFADAGVDAPAEIADVPLLHAYSRTAYALGHQGLAAESYRLLMPRVDGLSSRAGLRLAAVVEAAFAVMNDSRDGAGEAIAFLTPRLERGQFRGGEATARLTLTLALDRKGGGAANEGVEMDASGTSSASWVEPSLLERDLAALRAISFGTRHRESAREAWGRYLELAAPKDPFRPHAEAKLRALGGAP